MNHLGSGAGPPDYSIRVGLREYMDPGARVMKAAILENLEVSRWDWTVRNPTGFLNRRWGSRSMLALGGFLRER